MSPASSDTLITYDRYGFRIDKKRRFLLAGTIAYFRLAPSDWRDRLVHLRDCGFNTVDVYVPWNYHEATEGVFDFTTENRDLAAYLALCQELGLYVYFRPGPYICNEWDGGGLPSWLYTKPEIRLRQNDPTYLAYVRRYLATVNAIARPFLHACGGPIILYALENELDFYPCADPHGYITALRDQVLADGIDVPLTACIGNRTPIPAATGLVDDVLPTPNIYEGRRIEAESARARTMLHTSHFADGSSMSDVPAFVTEMGRDENSLKRILSTGYRGLGPFNFAGGANFGYTHAVNNWKNLSYLATSIDFGGMIGFDGRLQPAFYGARRVAGLIRAFEDEILTAEPTTSESGGPSCTNTSLGGADSRDGERQIYSLIGSEDRAFVFLPNTTEEAQRAQVTVGELIFPQHSDLMVPPRYTHVALANLPLHRQGIPATVRYSTAEVAALTHDEAGARLLLCGERDAEGELCLLSDQHIRVAELPEAVRAIPRKEGVTLVFRFGDLYETTLMIGDTYLRLAIADRDLAARDGLEYTPPAIRSVDLLALARAEGTGERSGSATTWAGGASQAMETLGVYTGAGHYEFRFELPAHDGDDPAPEITLPHAGDLLTAFIDGVYCGTFVGDGGALAIPLPTGIVPGAHTLRVRAEIWGHSNFHDERWPSAHLGSLRGVWGTPTMRDVPLAGDWRFAPITSGLPAADTERKQSVGTIAVAGGETRTVVFDRIAIPVSLRGAVLTLGGSDVFGTIQLGARIVGRYLFGPALPVALTGGPENRFFLPGEYLAEGQPLSIVLQGAGTGGTLTTALLEVFTDAGE